MRIDIFLKIRIEMEIKPQNILRTISLEEMSVLDYERVEFRLFVL